jgi:NagD protein
MSSQSFADRQGFLCDMDGVIYHGNRLLPGATDFVDWLQANDKRYLFITNSSERSPRELSEKLARLGLDVSAAHFYTSALATAAFLAEQRPGGSAYVIGEPGLIQALYEAGYSMNDTSPDYVIVGETPSYNYERIRHAVRLIRGGARLIGTNPDTTGPTEQGLVPATGALVAPIEMATGFKAYFVGKPNPIMMRNGLSRLGCRREDTLIVGDRMDTDIIAGLEAGIETVLVLSGVTAREDLGRFAYRPHHVLEHVGMVTEEAK